MLVEGHQIVGDSYKAGEGGEALVVHLQRLGAHGGQRVEGGSAGSLPL